MQKEKKAQVMQKTENFQLLLFKNLRQHWKMVRNLSVKGALFNVIEMDKHPANGD